jgi:hypothetical protein
MPDDSEQPTQVLSGAPTPPGGGTATLEPHEPRLSEGGPGGTVPPTPPTGYGGGGGGGDDWGDGENEGGDRRIAILAAIVGILVVVVLFLLLKPSDDNDDATVTTTPAAAVATPTPDEATPTPTPEATATPTPTPTPTPETPDGGTAVDGGNGPTLEAGSVTKFKVSEGDTVAFRVKNTGSAAESVHVHGYDKEFDVEPGETRSISFPATITGIFEIELHGSGEQIGELTVEP